MTLPQIDIRAVNIELARRNFWHFLKLQNPDFFNEKVPHLAELAQILQDFVEGKLLTEIGTPARILIINEPPRVGKSYTLTNFCAWILGRTRVDPNCWQIGKKAQVITVSYNDDLATKFSRYCRDAVTRTKSNPEDIVFTDIFEGLDIKKGNAAAKDWALNDDFASYLGAGLKGQITGSGCGLGIIDDPIKSASEAYNANTLAYIWDFYKNTFVSRLERGGLQIINHTRWRNEDLAGMIEQELPEYTYTYKRQIVENAIYGTDERGNEIIVGGDLLCESIVDWEDFNMKQKTMDRATFRANFFQETVDEEGRMYRSILTYTPDDLAKLRQKTGDEYVGDLMGRICAYIDTADTGADFLNCIVFLEYEDFAYILDVLYTDAGMEITEGEVAAMLDRNDVAYCRIESNSGGRGFARSVERILKADYNNISCKIDPFHQSKNKLSRILTASAWVQTNIFFPYNWSNRWGRFFDALTTYMKIPSTGQHDDAPDTITGVAEHFKKPKQEISFNAFRKRKR